MLLIATHDPSPSMHAATQTESAGARSSGHRFATVTTVSAQHLEHAAGRLLRTPPRTGSRSTSSPDWLLGLTNDGSRTRSRPALPARQPEHSPRSWAARIDTTS